MTDTVAKPARAGLARVMIIGAAFAAGAAAGGVGAAIGAAGLGAGSSSDHGTAASATSGPLDYVEIDNAFTSNLVDTGRYLQIRLSVSTRGGEALTAAITKHKPALVSAVLAVLGELGEADVADRAGKDRLRLRLKGAINDTLRAKGVAGSIDEVFFTSLVVQ